MDLIAGQVAQAVDAKEKKATSPSSAVYLNKEISLMLGRELELPNNLRSQWKAKRKPSVMHLHFSNRKEKVKPDHNFVELHL